MEKLKIIIRKILFLPPLPTLFAALFGYGFVLAVAIFNIQIYPIQIISYLFSAYALVVTITGFPHIISLVKRIKKYISEHPLMIKFKNTKLGAKYLNDLNFRTEISLYFGLFINLLYIGMNIFSGIRYRAVWFISLAFYYILLAVMRYMLLRKGKNEHNLCNDWKRYRMCGIILLIMNQALAAIVIIIVKQNKGFNYSGLLIYAMAMYSFYSVITAIADIVKFRKHGSPIISAAKAIKFVAALVSMLSLTTAMITQFGNDDEDFRKLMTGTVGGGVCTIVIIMAIFMIIRSNKNLKILKGDT